jgi:glutamate racemase
MKLIIIDSGLGGKDYIKKLRNLVNSEIDCEFVKPFENMITTYDKKYVRDNIINLLSHFSYKNIHSIIIACHSISSCILDILFENNFIVNNINIYEPIIPMCLYIKQNKKYNILVLSTPLTHKIKWHYRLMKYYTIKIKYVSFPLLAKEIEDNTIFNKSLERLKKQEEFIKKCDCVVLGCTHYNIIKDAILHELHHKYNFHGVILDSNEILLNFFINSCIEY